MSALQQELVTENKMEADGFTGRIMHVLNDAAIAVLLSIGHQTKLFDTMSDLAPSTSSQIAAAAHLNERYVREWLGGMVCGGILSYEASTQTYMLPREHRSVLTRAGGLLNLAKTAQFVGLLGEVEQKVIDCFRNGGGVPYSEFGRFHEVREEESRAVFDNALVAEMLPLVDGLPEQLHNGIDVADFGCGSGHAVNVMAKAFPSSRFTGYDISGDALKVGRSEASASGLSNAIFETRDLAVLNDCERFDAILAFDAVHDQAEPARVLANMRTALRRGGTLLMVDVKASSNLEDNTGIPWASWLYTGSTMHCMTVSLAEGGAGLGSVWGEQLALSMLTDAGFVGIQVLSVPSDPFNNYYIARRSS